MTDFNDLSSRIKKCMRQDQFRLQRRLKDLRRQRDQGKVASTDVLVDLSKQIDVSCQRRQTRLDSLPTPQFPEALPVSARWQEIAEAIEQYQVVIVCGETGSGKSTQLPKICLALGRGVSGMIGHTQPRRIAARTIAARVAEELGQSLGASVGFKIRFSDSVRAHTHIKVMTDGMLLAETQRDRFLNAYDTIIIDEAHERSLNIDFLFGFLKKLLPKRPDLKVIITSATIDPERFSRHFNDAPVIEVSGRTFPVEVRYSPLGSLDESEQDKDMLDGIVHAVDELSREGGGDVLVFLPGEREIKETADALRKHHPADTDIVPLYARQSTADQNRVFSSHKRRHIVLATNVAETSLTVPGIRYVIDPGVARISRYSPRTKVQRLPIEKISQASAEQRKGRCGRVADGICIRLYDEDDFTLRPEFTDAEIRRTSLASVILQLESLNFGHIENFPFIDEPDPKFVRDGYKLLEELGAVDASQELTELGRRLAKLPVDPRIARMLLAAEDENCLTEVLIIASGLSIQDPRERPLDNPQAADEAHEKYTDEKSDFISFLNLWNFLQEQLKHLSRNKMRKLCKTNFLSHKRMREWLDIHGQLRGMVHDMGLKTQKQVMDYDAIHRALLAGLLGNIGFLAERHEYTGARNVKFHIFPGSGLFKSKPKWIMAAELAETSRTYARTVAAIDPMWVVRSAEHLIKTNWFEPHWEKKAGQVIALEKVTLYGLVLIPDRKVNYSSIDKKDARRIFIEQALVQGEINRLPNFLQQNFTLIEDLQQLEHRSRRLDILVDDRVLFDFYESRLPEQIVSIRALEKWLKKSEPEMIARLLLSEDDLLQERSDSVSDSDFPTEMRVDGMQLKLGYHFSPGDDSDGVTLAIPLVALNQIHAERLEWLVPGLLLEKMTELIRSLPKSLRINFVPAPNFAHDCFNSLTPCDESLMDSMSSFLKQKTAIDIKMADWNLERLSKHLTMNIQVIDEKGGLLGESRDLHDLQAQFDDQIKQSFSEAPSWSVEQEGLSDWTIGELPRTVTVKQQGLELQGYPALIDEIESVAVRVVDTYGEAHHQTHAGLRRLFMLTLPDQMKYLQKKLPDFETMCLHYVSVGGKEELREDLQHAAVESAFMLNYEMIRTEVQFKQRREQGRSDIVAAANEICQSVAESLKRFQALNKITKGKQPLSRINAIADIQEQLSHLIYPGFVTATPVSWLKAMPRFLQALELRLQKIDRDPHKDRRSLNLLEPFWRLYADRIESLEAEGWVLSDEPELETYRWMLEEYRVSLFAQELKTSISVSPEKLKKQWQKVEG